ncbi:hypothetical protein SAMN05444128_0706 [Pontibacter indicus]|uniref:Uncharacterized protein n=1 Tax=Pontibacter indicus TaxID=1317125 RepID=A0A1R3WMJ6_9BACT|nr:hypothetical protein SAMN05444128_0706 [Pontibacter indicus]
MESSLLVPVYALKFVSIYLIRLGTKGNKTIRGGQAKRLTTSYIFEEMKFEKNRLLDQ